MLSKLFWSVTKNRTPTLGRYPPPFQSRMNSNILCPFISIAHLIRTEQMTNSFQRSEANDVSLLGRHSSWVHSWTLEHAYERPFLTVFFGNLNPKMLSDIVWTPKRHFLTSQRVFWAISRQIPCTGYFCRRVRRKKIKLKIKKIRPYISRICPDAPLGSISTNFGLRVRLVDVINCAKFYRNRLRGFDSVSGQIWTFPLNCDIAVNTVWTIVHTVIRYNKVTFTFT